MSQVLITITGYVLALTVIISLTLIFFWLLSHHINGPVYPQRHHQQQAPSTLPSTLLPGQSFVDTSTSAGRPMTVRREFDWEKRYRQRLDARALRQQQARIEASAYFAESRLRQTLVFDRPAVTVNRPAVTISAVKSTPRAVSRLTTDINLTGNGSLLPRGFAICQVRHHEIDAQRRDNALWPSRGLTMLIRDVGSCQRCGYDGVSQPSALILESAKSAVNQSPAPIIQESAISQPAPVRQPSPVSKPSVTITAPSPVSKPAAPAAEPSPVNMPSDGPEAPLGLATADKWQKNHLHSLVKDGEDFRAKSSTKAWSSRWLSRTQDGGIWHSSTDSDLNGTIWLGRLALDDEVIPLLQAGAKEAKFVTRWLEYAELDVSELEVLGWQVLQTERHLRLGFEHISGVGEADEGLAALKEARERFGTLKAAVRKTLGADYERVKSGWAEKIGGEQ